MTDRKMDFLEQSYPNIVEDIASFVDDLKVSYDVLQQTTDDLQRRAQKVMLLLKMDDVFDVLNIEQLSAIENFIHSPNTQNQIFHMSNVYKAGIEALKLKKIQLARLSKHNPQDKAVKSLLTTVETFLEQAKMDFREAQQHLLSLDTEVHKKLT